MRKARAVPLFIGRRYASLRSRNLLVGFISKLSVAGLSLGVAILITVLSVMNGFDRELRERILALMPHISVSTLPGYPLLDQAEWESYAAAVEGFAGVRGAAPQLSLQGMLLAKGRSRGIALSGVEPRAERRVSIIEDFLVAGSFDSLAPRAFNILIGAGLAESLGVEVGDSVMLVSTEVPVTIFGGRPRQKSFTVGGIFRVGSQVDGNLAMVHLRDAQTLYRLGNKVHGLRVQLDDLFQAPALGERLRAVLPPEVSLRYWTADFGNIYENIRLSKTLVGLLLFLLVAVAAFNVVVSLFMVVRDKEGDIAILRAMGISVATIRNIFLVQGFLIGLAGTLAGLALGVLLSLVVSDLVAGLERLLGIEFLSADIYPVNYLPSQIQLGDLAVVCGAALALSLLATLYPAFRASRVKPAEALRYE